MPALHPTSVPYLQQLQVRRLSLGRHQLCQHLRHDLHVPVHHFQLTAQLPDLRKGGDVTALPGKTGQTAEVALNGSAPHVYVFTEPKGTATEELICHR